MTDNERQMLFELAEELAGYLVVHYERESFQDSPTIERMAQVAAMMEASGREVPPVIRDVLRKAVEAGRPVGIA